ncbi:hypothetical protein DFH01_18880 [Falsiroseomonas bella]|uniref:Uncharacterized protein n=1 Tax=Falsiroseomonas bella TaxID=2184016 RepID=A0A317FDL5_9PROT|nr:hypothetical protein [Falsiroseomonas bella]PWS35658.1 hypothetical protein DFH01_18880 [Falsiroseomonas bella]
MSEIDRVFAGLGGGQSAPSARRELRRIPGKGGASATRTVEVVRLPTKGAVETPGRQRADLQMRAATWEDGFPAQSARPAAPAPEAPEPARAEPTAHVMPMWERSRAEPEAPPPAAEAPRPRRGRPPGTANRPPAAERRVADPFDPDDDGANCMRCGYAVESARERRGLLTCASCG